MLLKDLTIGDKINTNNSPFSFIPDNTELTFRGTDAARYWIGLFEGPDGKAYELGENGLRGMKKA